MPELTDQQLKDRVQKLENLLRVSGLVHVALFYIHAVHERSRGRCGKYILSLFSYF